jgi:hypothetical protein
VLAPVLDEYAVGFRVMHGFSSATAIYDVAQDCDDRDLIVLYVGDFDPSGLFMSEEDLPARVAKYDGDHIKIRRIAITHGQTRGLPSFPASDKRKDPRYRWFVSRHGNRCWELDAMDPNDLRDCVKTAIEELIEPVAWQRCAMVNAAEQESLKDILKGWGSQRDHVEAIAREIAEVADDDGPSLFEEALQFIETFEGTAGTLLDWWRSKRAERAAMTPEQQDIVSKAYDAKFNRLLEQEPP